MSTYAHAEAFALMWYACPCGHKERVWNSRDGVTPFSCMCPSCGKPELSHVQFREDVCRPDHALHKHQRFWRNGTTEEAMTILHRRIRTMKQNAAYGDFFLDELYLKASQQIRDGSSTEFPNGWPFLDTYIEGSP